MHETQLPYRELNDAILAYAGDALAQELLLPWVAAHGAEVDWLRGFAARQGRPLPAAELEELWRLYALGRVNELLLLRFQSGPFDTSDWAGPELTLEEYLAFFAALGLRALERPRFSAFHHEIVALEVAPEESQPLELVSCDWPCLMLGPLLFSRAGVRVRGGLLVARPELAESSTLYWAHRRKNRPHSDASHGWGSHSQWRTRFRRDYQLDGRLYFNVDARQALTDPEGLRTPAGPGPGAGGDASEVELTRAERIELLVNRCFLTSEKPHEELWPYDDRFDSSE